MRWLRLNGQGPSRFIRETATRSSLSSRHVIFQSYSTAAPLPLETPTEKHPIVTQTPQLNRFWKHVNMEQVQDGFIITLDGRKLRTPDGHVVLIPPNKRTLALLVSAEWEAQDKVLKSYSLPLTSIVVRAMDSFTDTTIRQGVIDNLLRYFKTDTICYKQSEPEGLVQMQQEYWDPLIEWTQQKFKVQVHHAQDALLGVKQDAKTVQTFKEFMESLDNLTLAALEKAVIQSKSFLIGLALVHRAVSVENAAIASRLEVLHQIKRWGEVEDSHDVDREDVMRQLGAVVCAVITHKH